MLRSTLRKLAKGLTSTSRRPARAATRRPTLEALEDRLVLSTARLLPNGSTLVINADAGFLAPVPKGHPPVGIVRHIVLEADAKDHTKLDVIDELANKSLGQFAISPIKTVDINVKGLDAIDLDDSNGLPLAVATQVSLSGPDAFGDSLNLIGSQPINPHGESAGAEFDASNAGGGIARLRDGFVEFQLQSGIQSMTDKWTDISSADEMLVLASGPAVTLSGQDGLTEQLSGLANGGSGPSTLTFAGKANVDLEAGGTVTLNATAAAKGLDDFTVSQFGKNSTLTINATPSNTNTGVLAGPADRVNVRANSGFVNINADATTLVYLGSNDNPSASVTSGIRRDVNVTGGRLLIADGGNVTAQEHVKVTAEKFLSTVTGTGLFGNGGAVGYQALSSLAIDTGRLANTYTLAPGQAGVRFSNPIFIEDLFSPAGLNVTADVDAGSGLDLHLINANPKAGSLTIAPSTSFLVGASFTPPVPTKPNGAETVNFFTGFGLFHFPLGLPSTVSYTGFDSVVL